MLSCVVVSCVGYLALPCLVLPCIVLLILVLSLCRPSYRIGRKTEVSFFVCLVLSCLVLCFLSCYLVLPYLGLFSLLCSVLFCSGLVFSSLLLTHVDPLPRKTIRPREIKIADPETGTYYYQIAEPHTAGLSMIHDPLPQGREAETNPHIPVDILPGMQVPALCWCWC